MSDLESTLPELKESDVLSLKNCIEYVVRIQVSAMPKRMRTARIFATNFAIAKPVWNLGFVISGRH
jgi:hypothetical protein